MEIQLLKLGWYWATLAARPAHWCFSDVRSLGPLHEATMSFAQRLLVLERAQEFCEVASLN